MEKDSRTVRAATTTRTGVEEITLACAHCGWRDVTRRTIPMVPVATSGSGGGGSGGFGGGGGGGGRSFGGSGRTGGGGGGGSY